MKPSDDEKLYIRLVGHANAHYKAILFANLINSIIVVIVLRNEVSLSRLVIWLATLVVIVTARAVNSHFFSPGTYAQARREGRIFVLGLALTGLTWGMAALFLFPENSFPHQIFIAFIIGGMVAGASVSSASIHNAFLVFSIPALLPLIGRLFFIGTEITYAMGLMLLVFFVSLLKISWQIYAAYTQTIWADLEKEKEIDIRKNVENKLRIHQEGLENKVANRTKELQEINLDLAEQIQGRKQTERKYQEIFHSTTDAMFIHEASTGKILEVNQAVLDMFGYSDEEIAPLEIGDISAGKPPYSQKEAEEKVRAALTQGPQFFEWRAKKKSKELFWVEVALKHTEFDGKDYIIAVVRDIEARKKAEENLLKVKKLESIGLLAGGIAHDFNNILTAILGSINLALFDKSIKGETQEVLCEAEKATIRAKALTQQLLTFAKGGGTCKRDIFPGESYQGFSRICPPW